jgi:hypothetical protein
MNKFKNLFVVYFLILILSTASFADDLEINKYSCKAIFKKYNLFPEIKSVKGWKRVRYNKRLNDYIEYDDDCDTIGEHETKEIYSCLFKYSHNVDILSRTIGGGL